jgi:hypothetical protein
MPSDQLSSLLNKALNLNFLFRWKYFKEDTKKNFLIILLKTVMHHLCERKYMFTKYEMISNEPSNSHYYQTGDCETYQL